MKLLPALPGHDVAGLLIAIVPLADAAELLLAVMQYAADAAELLLAIVRC